MSELVSISDPPRQQLPAILVKAREESAQRLLMAYAITGLFFMLLPGTFLGVWNLISISGHRSAISQAWLQAHGHAQIFGWIGTFILGIGFYSIPKMRGQETAPAAKGWIAWLLWTAGVLLRWIAGFYLLFWRVALPLSAGLELCAFLIFLQSVRHHRPANASASPNAGMPVWVLSVLVGTFGFGIGLLMNLGAALYASSIGIGPAFPPGFEARFLTLLAYAFIVPTIWGFSARWLPVFLGLQDVNPTMLRYALMLSIIGVALAQIGLGHVAPWIIALAAVLSIAALKLFARVEKRAKTTGVHPWFPIFVRIAYVWLLTATALGIGAAYFDHANGWVGASRHSLTVGFIAGMVFAIGQRILPAFAGMRILYSPRLMLICLVLLNAGCALRVSSEILAYESYWLPAWKALPLSAIFELAAVTVFAANLVLTFRQPPAHKMSPANAA